MDNYIDTKIARAVADAEAPLLDHIAELQARLDAIRIYVSSLDGSVGSPMWRIRTDIEATLNQEPK